MTENGREESDELLFEVPPSAVGMRLDRFLAENLKDVSRSQVQKAIRSAQVSMDGITAWKTGMALKPDTEISFSPVEPTPLEAAPEDIPLQVLYEDKQILVVDKPAGMVVHPAPGHPSGTLVNALLGRYPSLNEWEGLRPGIVHRLDRGTSGVIVVARTRKAAENLSEQFMERKVFKGYVALCAGVPQESGRIDKPIGRHPRDRKRFSTLAKTGRHATTLWVRIHSDSRHALLAIRILTGRTHQIRVHLSENNLPILGDTMYGPQRRALASAAFASRHFQDGALLHAALLGLHHPISGEQMWFYAPPARILDGCLELWPDVDLRSQPWNAPTTYSEEESG